MPFCYVGKATKIFFFFLAFLGLAGLIVGFSFLRHGGGYKPRDGAPPSFPLPDPIPGNYATPATAGIPESLSPPTAYSHSDAPPPPLLPAQPTVPSVETPPTPTLAQPTAPSVGAPPPVPSSSADTNTATPPVILVPPAPFSGARSPMPP